MVDDQFTLLEINSTMDLQINNNVNYELENFNSSEVVNLHGFTPMSGDNFTYHHHQRPPPHHHPLSFMPVQDETDTISSSFNFISHDHHQSGGSVYEAVNHFPTTVGETTFGGLNRDGMVTRIESFTNANPPALSSHGFVGEKKGCGSKKRKKNSDVLEEKPREVVHVRAKRGEATDSHSLAERMRREKINDKLRHLQDMVPGCYKTMGMSVMLDVTINYIRSLHNQIEFLSMKLSAASMFHDFNSPEMDAMENNIKGTNGHEAQVMERTVVGQGYGPDPPRFQSTWSPSFP